MLSVSQWTISNLTVGCIGPSGPRGSAGPTGLVGLIGPSGPVGIGVKTGPSGPSGLNGSTGPSGQSGVNASTYLIFTPFSVSTTATNNLAIGSNLRYGVVALTSTATGNIIVNVTQSGLNAGDWVLLKNCTSSNITLIFPSMSYNLSAPSNSLSSLWYVYYNGNNLLLY